MNLRNWLFVFDLDDTLISEFDYQRSGIAAVEAVLSSLYGVKFDGRIQCALDCGIHDIWAWACDQLDLPYEAKESLLWIYRLHDPCIQFAEGVEELISLLLYYGGELAILSDGRSITQRLKLRSLGLESLPLFLSEDYASVKPEIDRFVLIEQKWPGYNFVYIADNPVKDFDAPRSLNWLTIGAKWVNPRVHSNVSAEFDCTQPHHWVDSPSAILPIISTFID